MFLSGAHDFALIHGGIGSECHMQKGMMSYYRRVNDAVTFFRENEGSTNFHILMYMPIGSYHINKKFRLSPALSFILFSKMT